MKYAFLSAIMFLMSVCVSAQPKQHKIVFDLVSSDTADQSGVLRQINNIFNAAPNSKVEVVFHGKAVYALTKEKSTIKAKIDDLAKNKQVVFAACNNSMKRLQLTPADLISSATVVPVAMLELAEKQEEGWSYIKAGH